MKLFTALVLATFAACACQPKPVDPVDPSEPDGAVRGTCATACPHLRALDCPLGKPTIRGATCEKVCLNASIEGAADWPTTCLLSAKTCAAADRCK